MRQTWLFGRTVVAATMGQTCICCKGNKVAYVLKRMENARASADVQEDGCDLLYVRGYCA